MTWPPETAAARATALVRVLASIGCAPASGSSCTLAGGRGTTPAFYSCSITADCVAGTVCVDDGPGYPDTYCKPVCTTDAECAGLPYAGLRCQSQVSGCNGSRLAVRVCNDTPSRVTCEPSAMCASSSVVDASSALVDAGPGECPPCGGPPASCTA